MDDFKLAVVRSYGGGEQAAKVIDYAKLRELVTDIEDEMYSTVQGEHGDMGDGERPWSNDFAFGFIFGAQYALQGKILSGNAAYVLRRAFSECNAHYGDSVVLADITSRLIRYTLNSGIDG